MKNKVFNHIRDVVQILALLAIFFNVGQWTQSIDDYMKQSEIRWEKNNKQISEMLREIQKSREAIIVLQNTNSDK